MRRGAEKQITELADTAHELALSNLDETARQTFRDNAQLKESLALHVQEAESLRAANGLLHEKLRALKQTADDQAALAREATARADTAARDARQLRSKVATLESSLSHVVREFQEERAQLATDAAKAGGAAVEETEVLRRALEVKTAEVRRIKKLARNLLDQRSEVEQFFLESLALVKEEISSSREAYQRETRTAFDRSMRKANARGGNLPSIRTFGRAAKHSTNSVYDDFEGAGDLPPLLAGGTDIADLTWEQRERVLRLLFARMNAATGALLPMPRGPAPTDGASKAPGGGGGSFFLTQETNGRVLLGVEPQHAKLPALPRVVRHRAVSKS